MRTMLQSQSEEPVVHKKQSSIRYVYAGLAAAATLAILIFGYTLLSRSSSYGTDLYAQAYQFPTITKSRSASEHRIDQYLSEIRTGDYEKVLQAWQDAPTTDKDAHAKAYLLLESGQIDNASTIVESYAWEDEYYVEEAQWLAFLIAAKRGGTKEELMRLADHLPSTYQMRLERHKN